MDKHCFSLVRNVFCSSEALYIASLSFVIFILLLAFFETWDCCYESDLILVSGVASKSVFFFFLFFFCNKASNICLWSSNHETFRGRFRTAATSKKECFVRIVNGFQPLTIITKRSISDVAAVLDPPLPFIPYLIRVILSKNVKSRGFQKKIIRGVFYKRGGFKPSAQYVLCQKCSSLPLLISESVSFTARIGAVISNML